MSFLSPQHLCIKRFNGLICNPNDETSIICRARLDFLHHLGAWEKVRISSQDEILDLRP
jgi:hypothetical protein